MKTGSTDQNIRLCDVAKARFFAYSSVVDRQNEELWITDYVELHLSSMRASGIETISSEKARLYDLVENDYKHYAELVTNKYFSNNANERNIMPKRTVQEPVETDTMTSSDAELAELLLNKLNSNN